MTRKIGSSREARKQATELYDDLARWAFAKNLLQRTDDTENFIHRLNKLIDITVSSNKQRRTKLAKKVAES